MFYSHGCLERSHWIAKYLACLYFWCIKWSSDYQTASLATQIEKWEKWIFMWQRITGDTGSDVINATHGKPWFLIGWQESNQSWKVVMWSSLKPLLFSDPVSVLAMTGGALHDTITPLWCLKSTFVPMFINKYQINVICVLTLLLKLRLSNVNRVYVWLSRPGNG